MKNNVIQTEDPDNWKWGVFYFNKNDKRIFPPKRQKMMGWTINFANPISIMVFVAFIVLMTVIGIFIPRLFDTKIH